MRRFAFFFTALTAAAFAGAVAHLQSAQAAPHSGNVALNGSAAPPSLRGIDRRARENAAAGYADWPTFGFNSARLGYNHLEQMLNTANVGKSNLLWSKTLKGVMTAQPILATNVSTSGGSPTVLYVGTHDGLFVALNADSGASIWQVQLATASFNCGSDLTTGVDRTASYDRKTNRVYVEDGQNQLHALDMAVVSRLAVGR